MTKRTPQIESAILDGFADGRSLRSLCREHDISRTAFLSWMIADPDLARGYEDTQLLHAHALVDDCLAIADDPSIDLGDGRGGGAGSNPAELLRHARYRIDSRLKIARLHLKRYDAAMARRAREAEQIQIEWADEAWDEPAPASPARGGRARAGQLGGDYGDDRDSVLAALPLSKPAPRADSAWP